LWNQKSGVAQRRLALKKEKLEEANMETHRVSVTVTDPNHTMSTMRKEKIEKRVRVQARDKQHAIDSAIHHYKKAGYRVHDHNYIGKVNEQLEEGRAAKYYEIAQSHKEKADAAKDASTRNAHMADYHDSMSRHHDEMGRSNLAQSHADKAEKYHEKSMVKEAMSNAQERGAADKHYGRKYNNPHDKGSQEHSDYHKGYHSTESEKDYGGPKGKPLHKFESTDEEVAANNVGSGNIAGTQGDAGKKPVMTKEPLKRKKLTDFKEWIEEATYQGRDVPLNKPMKGDVKKSKVYVDPDGDGKAKKVEFGDPNMSIKKHIPARRRSFRARHNCDNPGPKDKARYWSCKAW